MQRLHPTNQSVVPCRRSYGGVQTPLQPVSNDPLTPHPCWISRPRQSRREIVTDGLRRRL